MGNNNLSNALANASSELNDVVKGLSLDKLNERPESGEWNTSEILEHLYKIEGFTIKIINGSKKKTERDYKEKTEIIKNVFSNFDKKYTASAIISPAENFIGGIGMLNKLLTQREKFINIIKKNELDLLCLDFEHKGFGYLTVYEWIYSVIYHSQRHKIQIERLIA